MAGGTIKNNTKGVGFLLQLSARDTPVMASPYIKGFLQIKAHGQTAFFVLSSSQIRTHKAFGCTTAQRRHTIQMARSALWWIVACFCLS